MDVSINRTSFFFSLVKYFFCIFMLRFPKAALLESWEYDLHCIKNCCLVDEEDQSPEMINRLALKRLRFCKLKRMQQSEVILDLMRNNRNSKQQGGLKSALVCQFPFCRSCIRHIYGLSPHRWRVYYGIHLADPNQRRLLRADIAQDREGFKERFFVQHLITTKVLCLTDIGLCIFYFFVFFIIFFRCLPLLLLSNLSLATEKKKSELRLHLHFLVVFRFYDTQIFFFYLTERTRGARSCVKVYLPAVPEHQRVLEMCRARSKDFAPCCRLEQKSFFFSQGVEWEKGQTFAVLRSSRQETCSDQQMWFLQMEHGSTLASSERDRLIRHSSEEVRAFPRSTSRQGHVREEC